MNRNETLLNKRKRFVKLASESPQKASELLEQEALALRKCKNTNDLIFALSQIFCVSEATITKDLYAD
jgi:hypothetical protein